MSSVFLCITHIQPQKREHNKKNAASPSSSPSPRQLGASSTIWLYNVSLATRSWVKNNALCRLILAQHSLPYWKIILEVRLKFIILTHHVCCTLLKHGGARRKHEDAKRSKPRQTRRCCLFIFLVRKKTTQGYSFIPLPGVPACRVHVSRFSSRITKLTQKCILYQNNHHCFALTLYFYRDDVISSPSVLNNMLRY